jgi:hypothetical protein
VAQHSPAQQCVVAACCAARMQLPVASTPCNTIHCRP